MEVKVPLHPDRREFLLLSLILGICAVWSPGSVASGLKRMKIAPEDYSGPLLNHLNDLISKLDQKKLSPIEFVKEVQKRYAEFDLNKEFSAWLSKSHEENAIIPFFKGSFADHQQKMSLFFIGPKSAHPPHAHHDIMSVQTVLKGQLHLRQYDRVSRVDEWKIKIKLAQESVLKPGESILMTEHKHNVHWFGTESSPAVVFNFNVQGTPDSTFDSRQLRAPGRSYLDPMGARDGDFLIASEISRELSLELFAHRPLSDFPLLSVEGKKNDKKI